MIHYNVGDLVKIKTEGLKDKIGIVIDHHNLLYSVKDLEVPIYRILIEHQHIYVKENILKLISSVAEQGGGKCPKKKLKYTT